MMKFQNTITGQMVEPQRWQLALKPGDYYCIEQRSFFVKDIVTGEMEEYQGPTIYGEIITNEPEEDELPYRPGFFLVRAFSQWCREGELGMFCIVDATRLLTREEFDTARLSGWPPGDNYQIRQLPLAGLE